MLNSTFVSHGVGDHSGVNHLSCPLVTQGRPPMLHRVKKKRNQPGNPDPEAEVVALSPRTLMATNRFLCEICGKGFQRDQNLQLHRRGHNLPWKLKQRDGNGAARKKVYVCPEETCTHHHPSRALGDLTGIKKHFWRKHGEKRWSCIKCTKKYAVMSDWKAHFKTCGTREYKCSCGANFSRKDSFATHRAFCEALAEESARFTASLVAAAGAGAATEAPADVTPAGITPLFPTQQEQQQQQEQDQLSELLPFPCWDGPIRNPNPCLVPTRGNPQMGALPFILEDNQVPSSSIANAPFLSAAALLQEAETVGQLVNCTSTHTGERLNMEGMPPWQRSESQLTRDFLGVTSEPELDLLSIIDAGGLGGGADFMVSPPPPPLTAASSDRVSLSTNVTSAMRPGAPVGFGFHNHSAAAATPATAANVAWWEVRN
ncbi:unnamed protein product [Spirodela intermedia]|uniref:C2H2-type domain-containing protein n=2 Tax=Spirodela intermedia TaxID=51605 RepID=A0A7I8L428_SPIIN|nr:unnamed protein product [Spirodela intermedia]CAA6667211.1 unnamed protein product [Spirodela intermedia]CAA7404035.1 unnamed protein product [Spirodela intermedia]